MQLLFATRSTGGIAMHEAMPSWAKRSVDVIGISMLAKARWNGIMEIRAGLGRREYQKLLGNTCYVIGLLAAVDQKAKSKAYSSTK